MRFFLKFFVYKFTTKKIVLVCVFWMRFSRRGFQMQKPDDEEKDNFIQTEEFALPDDILQEGRKVA